MDIDAIRAAARAVDTTAICDSDKATRVMSSAIAHRSGGDGFICGPAHTVRCQADFLAVLHGVETAEAGHVLVVDGGGLELALAGEFVTRVAENRSLAGIIIDGGYRDLAYVRRARLPVYSRYISPMAGTTRRRGRAQVPVMCGGVAIAPRDLVIATDDGIVVLDPGRATEVLEKAKRVKEAEHVALEAVAAGATLNDVLNLGAHHRAVEDDPRSTLKFLLDGIDEVPLAGKPS
jgi:4-hydroxy-4-methyl-2-oxoglutarate aldolase